MTYGIKLTLVGLFLSFFLFTGCENKKDFTYPLYDDYEIRSVNGEVKLYKNEEIFKINDLDYQIEEFKYNSDVVCLKLNDNYYYIIYYVDGEIYGPHDLTSLKTTIESLSMTFDNDFQDVDKVRSESNE